MLTQLTTHQTAGIRFRMDRVPPRGLAPASTHYQSPPTAFRRETQGGVPMDVRTCHSLHRLCGWSACHRQPFFVRMCRSSIYSLSIFTGSKLKDLILKHPSLMYTRMRNGIWTIEPFSKMNPQYFSAKSLWYFKALDSKWLDLEQSVTTRTLPLTQVLYTITDGAQVSESG